VRPAVILLLSVALLASGCTREKVNPYEPNVPDNLGAVRVIVQDNMEKRVANATVLIQPAGAFGSTDHNGIFVASDLSPGNKTITVNAPGYSDAKRNIVVKAGQVNEFVLFVDRLR
jgi:hypothetical protein